MTTIPKTAKAIFAVFSLRKGLAGQVDGVLMRGTDALVTVSLEYTSKNTWGDFKINAGNGVPPGDYVMQFTFRPTGEAIQLTVHGQVALAAVCAGAAAVRGDGCSAPGGRR